MMRFACVPTVALCAVLMATGCAGSTRKASEPAKRSAPALPLVVAHPAVQVKYQPSDQLRHLSGTGGRLISATQLAFATTGSTGCLWLPTRLTVLSPTAIRLDMRFPDHRVCLADLIRVPIAVKIPGIVNVHRPLTVRLAYKANYSGEPSQRWHRKFVAPAIPRL